MTFWVLGVAGCKGPDAPKDGPVWTDLQGLVAGIRTLEGERVLDLTVDAFVGTQTSARPDSGGFTYFFDLTPDRVPVTVAIEDHAWGYAAPEIEPQFVSGASFVALPLGETLDADPAGPIAFEGDGLRVDVPAGTTAVDGVAATTTVSIGGRRVEEAERDTIPGVQIAIRNDVDLARVRLYDVQVVRAWTMIEDYGRTVEEGIALLPDQLLTLTVDLEAGSPLLDLPDVRAYRLASSVYWTETGQVTIDPVARTATFESGGLGWHALGVHEPERGCVIGTLVDGEGNGIDGAEVRSTQEGIAGIDASYAIGGTFCVPVDVGATTALHAIGFAADRSAMYRWQGTAVGSSVANCGDAACTDLGLLEVETHRDADRDQYFSGPGGDCDDRDDQVNPTLAFGDGSFCGGAL